MAQILSICIQFAIAASAFALLRVVAQRYFHEHNRADAVAACTVIAFIAGTVFAHGRSGQDSHAVAIQTKPVAATPTNTAPPATQRAPLPSNLKSIHGTIHHYTTVTGPSNWSIYRIAGGLSYTIRAGDRLEYDQDIDAQAEPNMVAGLDLLYGPRSERFSLAGVRDDSGHAPIAAVGHGKWVHRRFDLSSLSGQHVTALLSQLNGAGAIGARYANAAITHNGKVSFSLYSSSDIKPVVYSEQGVQGTIVDSSGLITAGK